MAVETLLLTISSISVLWTDSKAVGFISICALNWISTTKQCVAISPLINCKDPQSVFECYLSEYVYLTEINNDYLF